MKKQCTLFLQNNMLAMFRVSVRDSQHWPPVGRPYGVRGAVWQPVTPERIDAMVDADVEELLARYEARLGAASK